MTLMEAILESTLKGYKTHKKIVLKRPVHFSKAAQFYATFNC